MAVSYDPMCFCGVGCNFSFLKLVFTGVYLFYNVVLVSTVQNTVSVMHIHTSTIHSFLESFPIVLGGILCATQ